MYQAMAKIQELMRDGLLPIEVLQALIDEYDPWVQVDRTAELEYPKWVSERLYLELEKTGPASFDITKLERWLHPQQVEESVEGNDIHEFLKNNNLLDGCLGLADLLAIQERGGAFFQKHFAENIVFGWRDVARHHGGDLGVPRLIGYGSGVFADWKWLRNDWYSSDLALRFASTRDSKP